jgi:hypothetical protein
MIRVVLSNLRGSSGPGEGIRSPLPFGMITALMIERIKFAMLGPAMMFRLPRG